MGRRWRQRRRLPIIITTPRSIVLAVAAVVLHSRFWSASSSSSSSSLTNNNGSTTARTAGHPFDDVAVSSPMVVDVERQRWLVAATSAAPPASSDEDDEDDENAATVVTAADGTTTTTAPTSNGMTATTDSPKLVSVLDQWAVSAVRVGEWWVLWRLLSRLMTTTAVSSWTTQRSSRCALFVPSSSSASSIQKKLPPLDLAFGPQQPTKKRRGKIIVRKDDDDELQQQRPKPERLVSLLLKALGWIGEEHEANLARVVTILDDLHVRHGVVDLLGEYSPSNIIISVLVLSALQQRCHQIAADDHDDDNIASQNNSNPNNDNNVVDATTLADLAYYAVYASAAYGWKLDRALRGGAVGPWQVLLWRPRQRHRRRRTTAMATKPPRDDPNLATVMRRTGVPARDILVARWTSTVQRPAYFLARDRHRHVLVLSIRGTFSVDDLLTDLCCTTSEIDVDVDVVAKNDDVAVVAANSGGNKSSAATVLVHRVLSSLLGGRSGALKSSSSVKCRAHSGMRRAAESLRSELQGILAAELQSSPAYSLVLVGHSMAGGIAALLGILLHQTYANVKVFAYGPAPCVSLPMPTTHRGRHHGGGGDNKRCGNANYSMSQYITSVIHESDPFKAMSLQHVADLSRTLARLCADHTLRDSIIAGLLTQRRSRFNDDRLVSFRNDLYGRHHSTTASSDNDISSNTNNCNKLYPPGKVILLSRRRDRSKQRGWRHLFGAGRRQRLTVRETGQRYFDDLEFPSVTGFSLHAPTAYEECLRQIVRDDYHGS